MGGMHGTVEVHFLCPMSQIVCIALEHNEFYPNGAEREGTARFSLATGGTSLIEEVHSDGSAGRLDFMVVIWWDNEARSIISLLAGMAAIIPVRFAALPTGMQIRSSITTS